MKAKPYTFRQWIERFKDVDLPIGDLAGDIVRSKDFPKKNDREAVEFYLRSKGADGEIVHLFNATWEYYLATR